MAKVLIVDDSPTEVHVLSGFLKKHGFEVETAADGGEGIEKARAVKPDLILMDVVMPGMNGFQATRELARAPETASIPVIMVTTKGLETDKIWGMRQGAKDYLVKPVTEAVLVEKVRGALAGHD
jgi:twitching motility two-component system response regulator PilH